MIIQSVEYPEHHNDDSSTLTVHSASSEPNWQIHRVQSLVNQSLKTLYNTQHRGKTTYLEVEWVWTCKVESVD